MKWSAQSWHAAEPIYQKIVEHPFLRELTEGTLPRQTFLFYLQQDALYLAEFGRILAGIASKLLNNADRETFLGFSASTISVEKNLHESYLGAIGAGFPRNPSPTCLLYTGYLTSQLHSHPVEVALAAVLPCFWIYQKVGSFIVDQQTRSHNPYQPWIDTYGSDEFARKVDQALAVADGMAEGPSRQNEMTLAFVMASRMEWMFWDSAYRQEPWPV